MQPKWHIGLIGNGAVATGVASLLSVMPPVRIAIVGRNGPVAFKAIVERNLSGEAPVSLDLAPLAFSKLDAAIFTVKAYDLASAIAQHVPHLPPGIPLILSGNGALDEIAEKASKTYPDQLWRLGTTTLAVSALGQGRFAIKNPKGKLEWGALETGGIQVPPTPVEKFLCETAPEHFGWSKSPLAIHSRKWLFNTCLNSLAGKYRLARNEDALAYREELEALFSEAYELGELRWGAWREPKPALFAAFLKLIHETASNENSMAADLRAGRRTESDFLAGISEKYPGFNRLKAIHKIVRNS